MAPQCGPAPLCAANFRYDHAHGRVLGYISERGIQRLALPHPESPPRRVHMLHSAPNSVLGRTLHGRLDQYFSGANVGFEDLPLDLDEGSPFERQVWEAVRAVPRGETISYSSLAAKLARDGAAARAMGRALGANPVHILVPCHRAVSAGGALTGYAAGIEWKKLLLSLEGALLC